MHKRSPIFIDLPMPIETPRLIIRPPRVGDGKMLNEAIIDSFDLLSEYMHWATEKPSVEESEAVVKREAAHWILNEEADPELMVLILEKRTKALIGASGFNAINREALCVEIGYWVNKNYAGNGFITEAVNALTQYAFNILKVKRIAITCDIDNERSKKIAERLGYQLESIMPLNGVKPKTGKFTDTLVYVRTDLINLPDLDINWG
jgi:ribosomal-protein-serine acetyltransferase